MADTIFHDSRDPVYRTPFGAQPAGAPVTVRLRAPETAVCTLRLWTDETGERLLPMALIDGLFSAEITLPETAGLVWYAFRVEQDGRQLFYGAPEDGLGGAGILCGSEGRSWQITVYTPSPAPDWYKNAVVYQIFPDRFCRGADWRERRELARRDESRRGPRRIWHEDWNDVPFYTKDGAGAVTRWDFFGGTLRGIREKLPYLKELGVGAIYLNPIFQAASNHRYDTGDYRAVDPLLGDEAEFSALCSDAHAAGIRIILDGVFSHTGADSHYFDYYGNYGGGAYSDESSPYRAWYRFRHWPDDYESWWGVGDLPNVEEENPDYKRFIVTGEDSVARRWLRLGADGWRLDVADELPDSFIESFKTAIRTEKADSLLLGEVWEDASNKVSYGQRRRYLFGRELDATMHYPFRQSVTDFLLGTIDAPALCRRLWSIAEHYPPEALLSALNLIDSHDRARAITVLGGAPEGLSDTRQETYSLPEEQYRLGRARLKMAALLQYACPGVPCVYYGDEAGAQGYSDPYNRGPFPWGREDRELLAFYRRLGEIYAACGELKGGAYAYESAGEDVFLCRRWTESSVCIAAVNRSADSRAVEIHGTDLLTGRPFDGTLPPLGAVLLKN